MSYDYIMIRKVQHFFMVTVRHFVALQQGLAAEAFVVLAAAALDFQCHGSTEHPFWRALRRGQGQQPKFSWSTSKNEKNLELSWFNLFTT